MQDASQHRPLPLINSARYAHILAARTLFFAYGNHTPRRRGHRPRNRRHRTDRRDGSDACSGSRPNTRPRNGGHIGGTRIRRAYSARGAGALGSASRQRHARRDRRGLWQSGIRPGRRRTGRLRRTARLSSDSRRSMRGRTLIQHPGHSHRRRTPRCRRPGRSGRLRRAHTGKTPLRRSSGCRRPSSARAPHPAALPGTLHRVRIGLPPSATPKPHCPHPGRRHGSMHPLRPVRIALPDSSHRSRQRNAHRPGTMSALLRLRQRLPGRSYDTPFAAALARNFARRKPPVTLL